MKNFLVLFYFTCFFCFSQSQSIQINWGAPNDFFNESGNIKLPAFSLTNYNYKPSKGITYKLRVPKSLSQIQRNSELQNVVYEKINQSELFDLDPKLIPTTHQLAIEETQSFFHFEFYPIIKKDDGFFRVVSFNISNSQPSLNITDQKGVVQESYSGIYDSQLDNGTWFRFSIEDTGVYKIDYSFLKSLGVNVSNLNSSSIQLYGFGGDMLPLKNRDTRFNDIPENAIKMFDGNDGVFNSGDYFLFYGQGNRTFNNVNNSHINPYSDVVYYYIKIGNGISKQVGVIEPAEGNPDLIVSNYKAYKFHEIDEYNIAKMGRRWFGDRFDYDNEKTFDFEFTNLITEAPVDISVHAAAVSQVSSSMTVESNGVSLGSINFSATSKGNLASASKLNTTQNISSQTLKIKLTYDNGGLPSSTAFIDYIRVSGVCDLKHSGETLIFDRSHRSAVSASVQYNLKQAQSISEVWDISDPYYPKAISNNDLQDDFNFSVFESEPKTYITVSSSTFLVPDASQSIQIANQNLKGTILKNSLNQKEDIDYLIVTPSEFLTQARRLADLNKIHNNLKVKVVTLDEIFIEFSGGQQDVSAIRNFVKYIYDNASSNVQRLKYLCLFGDASFDFKNRVANNTNFVPIWNSYESFSLSFSFISDDFFGMMDAEEGDLDDFIGDSDIAVGRIIADSPLKAKELVDKIEAYYNEKSYGKWRNNYLIVSDDVDESWERILQETTDRMATKVIDYKPYINPLKIHSDSYIQESTSSGDRYPQAKAAFFDRLDEGALVINYFGHGGEDGLASERIFDKFDAQNLRNTNRYNCFVTVTCEFTKFDDPLRKTAGEYVYWNSEGGAIGLITTTRQIYVNVGVSLNEILTKHLFDNPESQNISMAEALRRSKNEMSNTQKLLVFFIGDPAMKLAIPNPKITLTNLNGSPITASNNTIKALDRVTLSGELQSENGSLLNDYSGEVVITVFDKDISRTTLGNDNQRDSNNQLITMDFLTLGEIVFNGRASVVNGVFDVNFVVPKDVNFNVGTAKVSFYAKQDNVLSDQTGFSKSLLIGGLNSNATEDIIPPTMQLYMNDESFVSGGITNRNPTLIVHLSDENGINTSSGVGHDIVGVLDGNESSPIILNNYYVADVDDFSNGEVVYKLRDLEPGLHTISVKAWDVYNNATTSEIQFMVYDENETLVVNNVLNYPNPFINYTEFWFNHNSSDPLDIMVQVYTVSGKLVRTLRGVSSSGNYGSNSLSRDVIWDGKDDFGEKVAKGTYVYKLKVKSERLNKQVVKIEKLVIL